MTGDMGTEGPQLSPGDFHRLASFISDYSGIRLPPSKRVMVEGRLRRHLRRHGFDDFDSYCHYLFEDGGLEQDGIHIIDAITTNKTEFFRENEHFRYLADTALPALTAGRIAPSIKVWSAACSTGAEPYTLAMVLADHARKAGELRYSILGTDLCVEVLERAVNAVYPEDLVQPIPIDMRRRYLLRSRDSEARQVRIAPEIRRTVRFARMNLMDEVYPVEQGFAVIFCRNVLIYFSRTDQKAVLSRLTRHLAPDGYLFLGHSETITGMALPLRAVSATIFMKA